MKEAGKDRIVVFTVAGIGIIAFLFWFFYDPVNHLKMNVPGLDDRPVKSVMSDSVIIGEKFRAFSTLTSALTGKWPRFRGTDFDNINKEKIELIDKWGDTGPRIVWKVDLGDGHAAPAIYNGRVYLLDYDERKKNDALRCFSLETGQEVWRRWYFVNLKRNHGMSRTIPAVTDKYVVTIGPRCHVMCANPLTGDFLWGIDLARDFHTEVPLWYTGQCPLIANDTAVIAPGGNALMIGVDCRTGKVVWRTPNPDKYTMSHSSIVPMLLSGKKMYVYAAIGGVVGVSASGPDKGSVLWKTDKFKASVIAPTPLILENGKIFLTAGYGYGSMVIQVSKEDHSFSVKILQTFKPSGGLASEQQTPVLYKHHVFAILPKDGGIGRNQFVCCDAADVTKILWTSSKSERYGLGPYILADGKFFILSDDGTLTIAKAGILKFEYLDKAKIMDGQDAWGPIALADGYLLMRDSKQMICIDVRKKQ
jgi:outer membrane protein assembly factor BamB